MFDFTRPVSCQGGEAPAGTLSGPVSFPTHRCQARGGEHNPPDPWDSNCKKGTAARTSVAIRLQEHWKCGLDG